MRAILSHLERRRTATDLTVETMGDVARRVSGSSPVTEQATASWK